MIVLRGFVLAFCLFCVAKSAVEKYLEMSESRFWLGKTVEIDEEFH